jgi:hypothetical protein
MTKHLVLSVVVCITFLIPLKATTNIAESFKITTHNVNVKESTESSINLRSENDSYSIKLEPNREGKVIFSLSGIGYTSTGRFPNLTFGVEITGYHLDEVVYPSFSIDGNNSDTQAEKNRLSFRRIHGSIPVWFNDQVDSIKIEYSNSLSVNVHQYLRISDLKIISTPDVSENPDLTSCKHSNIMIAVDGSSSIDKAERMIIGNQIMDFVRQSHAAKDSHNLCVLEFGSDVKSIVESSEKKVLLKAIKSYKKNKNRSRKSISWTNWSVAFDEAIQRKPEIFIFITDGWSNWNESQPSSFIAQYEELISKSNTLKANGTRLLFVTSNMDRHENAKTVLSKFLNGDQTRQLNGEMANINIGLHNIDLISMQGFSKMSELNLASIFRCPVNEEKLVEVVEYMGEE